MNKQQIIIYCYSIYYLGRLIVSKLFTVIVLVTLSYICLQGVMPNRIVTIHDITLYISGQDLQIKAAIISSVITIVGVFISIAFAASQWKKNTNAKRRLETAGNIVSIMHDMAQAITEIRLFAIFTKELLISVDANGFENVGFRYNYWKEQRKRITEIEARLWVLWHEFNRWTAIGRGALTYVGVCQITDRVALLSSDIKIKSSTLQIYSASDEFPDIDYAFEVLNPYCIDLLIDLCQKSGVYITANSARINDLLLKGLKEYSWRELLFLIKSAPSMHCLLHAMQTGEANDLTAIKRAYKITQNIK